MSDVRVVPMTREHGASVLAIFAEGIDTGHATFEHTSPTWDGTWRDVVGMERRRPE